MGNPRIQTFRLGYFGLPPIEVELLKLLVRLAGDGRTYAWQTCRKAPFDALVTDAANANDPRRVRAIEQVGCPVMFIGQAVSAQSDWTFESAHLPRPLCAAPLGDWLTELAQRALRVGASPSGPAPICEFDLSQPLPLDVAPLTAEVRSAATRRFALTGADGTHRTQWNAAGHAVAPSDEHAGAKVPNAAGHGTDALLVANGGTTNPAPESAPQSRRRSGASAASERFGSLVNAWREWQKLGVEVDTALRYKLVRWPSQEWLGKDPVRLRVASLLARRPLLLDEVCAASSISWVQCQAIFCSLKAAGYLDSEESGLVKSALPIGPAVPAVSAVAGAPEASVMAPAAGNAENGRASRAWGTELVAQIRLRLQT
ncbi:hypothetical protein AAV94_12305 [Lampropedia cohaerens]|uniref:Uncharacterized protein n=1 Tax=Lampropedia cohaerens TaxID=1610491 RepID=A0A0U1PXJ5_9BURK|nr:hypothetical protein [Lampropedia cohaerens]KKW67105.1 hypothetical protein AAV94_12305 [Lampropedia cohaerens]